MRDKLDSSVIDRIKFYSGNGLKAGEIRSALLSEGIEVSLSSCRKYGTELLYDIAGDDELFPSHIRVSGKDSDLSALADNIVRAAHKVASVDNLGDFYKAVAGAGADALSEGLDLEHLPAVVRACISRVSVKVSGGVSEVRVEFVPVTARLREYRSAVDFRSKLEGDRRLLLKRLSRGDSSVSDDISEARHRRDGFTHMPPPPSVLVGDEGIDDE